MGQRVYRSIEEPIREGELSYAERWLGEDRGLITCWEVGRKLAERKPELVFQAKNDQLPTLGWKGGIPEKIPKYKWRWGSLNYLAEWQALRDEDLDIDLDEEPELVCSRTGIKVIFTCDLLKLGAEEPDELEKSLLED